MGANNQSETGAGGRPRRRGVWRWVRRIYRTLKVVLLILILLGVGYVLWGNHRGEKRLRETLERLQARGLPTSLALVEGHDEGAGDKEDGTRYYLAAFELASNVPGLYEADLPYVGAAPDPEVCDPIDTGMAARLRQFVAEQREFHALLEKARRCRTFRYRIQVLQADGEGLRPVLGMRRAAKLQMVRCLHAQAAGQPAEALDACEGMVGLSQSFRGRPHAIVVLVRYLVGKNAVQGAEQVLSRMTPPADGLERLRRKMLLEAESLDPRDPISAEIAFLAEEGQDVQRHMARTTYLTQTVLTSGAHDVPYAFLEQFLENSVVMRIYRKLGIRGHVQTLTNVARVWGMLCPGGYKMLFAQKIDSALEDLDAAAKGTVALADRANHALSLVKSDSEEASWARALLAFVAGKATVKVAATALAVERYRIEHGSWPGALADLALPDDEATDPFDGKPLRYTRTDDGCRIYSVGRNQRDDGGVEDPNGDKDDIVFRLFDAERRNRPQRASSDVHVPESASEDADSSAARPVTGPAAAGEGG